MAIVPLNADKHASLKLKAGVDVTICKDQHMLPIVVHEFMPASTEFPVVFVKNTETGKFQPIVMLGLQPGENLFMDADGKWTAGYFPGVMTNFPFKLISSNEDQTKVMLGIDDSCHLLSESDGRALFEDGKPSELLNKCQSSITSYMEHTQVTEAFAKTLADMDLLVEKTLDMTIADQPHSVNGIYLIDEEKWNALDDEKFLDMRKRGFLPVIYAHMNSLNQLHRLARNRQTLQQA